MGVPADFQGHFFKPQANMYLLNVYLNNYACGHLTRWQKLGPCPITCLGLVIIGSKEQPPKGILVEYTLGHVPQSLWGTGVGNLKRALQLSSSLFEQNRTIIQYTDSDPLVSTQVVFENT